MIFLMILAFVVAYAGAASWAVRTGGHPRLWGAGGLALLAIVILAWLVGVLYSVPSIGRLVLYATALLAPTVVVTNVLLAGGPTSRVPRAVRAMVGAIVGFVCGFLLVVFGLGVW